MKICIRFFSLVFAAAALRVAGVEVYPAGEADRQFAALENDLKNRASIAAKATEALRPEALILVSDRDPLDIVLRRSTALLEDVKNIPATGRRADFESMGKELDALRTEAETTSLTNSAARRTLFDRTLGVRRKIAFSNPVLNFDDIVFIKRFRAIYDHMCDQFYGTTARPGGGLYILKDAFGASPHVNDVLANSVVTSGRMKGQEIYGGDGAKAKLNYDGQIHLSGDETHGGAFLSPALSYDGKEILFAYCECSGSRDQEIHTDPERGHWAAGRCFHVFAVNTDGGNLRQLTDGTWNEFDPCPLPNGRIAFISERRGGYLRCGRACPLYNLYDMTRDGGEINLLSIHDSNEWNPSVTHDGRIVWTRWDYVDRHGCIAHMPWITRLDGTDPRALHGNFAPRHSRADMELNVRPVPASQKFVATAAPHHGQAFGSLVLIDPRTPDDDAMGPVKRITPDVAFPESQGGAQVYGTPWPLSENYFLCVYDPGMVPGAGRQGGPYLKGDYGIYLIDGFGNKELIYRDPEIGCLSPIPLRATEKPPVTRSPSIRADAKPVKPGDTGEGTMAVVNIYNTMRPWPEGMKVKELRIMELLPCSVPSGGLAPHQTGKRVAEAGDSIVPARWVLGTVPIESDGSAYFKVPAYRELFFQLVDDRGMAVQSMRSGTAIRDGEHLVCAGCHEQKHSAAVPSSTLPLAMRRAPSVPVPDVEGSNPFSYPRLVQPVLDSKCVECHAKEKKSPSLARDPVQNKFFTSYNNLMKYSFTSYGDACRTIPGKFGSHASSLISLLEKGHYDVKLTPEEFHRFTLWQDCVSMFYGVFEKEPGEAQLRGDIAAPTLR
jgi:hypothetical protein